MACGFVPTEKVVTSNNNERVAEYILATTGYGQKVLVEMDESGYVTMGDHPVYIQSQNASSIPYSHKIDVMDCMKDLSCGAAFICEGGVCTLKSGVSGPEETSFVVAEDLARKTVVLGGHPMAIPIVKMSEIRANPMEAKKNIDIATRRIMMASYDSTKASIKELGMEINHMHKNFNQFCKSLMAAFDDLNGSIKALDERRIKNGAPCSEEDYLKARKIYYNLYMRYELLEQLISYVPSIVSEKEVIKSVGSTFCESSKYIHEKYNDLYAVRHPNDERSLLMMDAMKKCKRM